MGPENYTTWKTLKPLLQTNESAYNPKRLGIVLSSNVAATVLCLRRLRGYRSRLICIYEINHGQSINIFQAKSLTIRATM